MLLLVCQPSKLTDGCWSTFMATLNLFACLYRTYRYINSLKLLNGKELLFSANTTYSDLTYLQNTNFLVICVQNISSVSRESNLLPCWNVVTIYNYQLLYACVLDCSGLEICYGQQYGAQTNILWAHLWMPVLCEIASSLGDLEHAQVLIPVLS